MGWFSKILRFQLIISYFWSTILKNKLGLSTFDHSNFMHGREAAKKDIFRVAGRALHGILVLAPIFNLKKCAPPPTFKSWVRPWLWLSIWHIQMTDHWSEKTPYNCRHWISAPRLTENTLQDAGLYISLLIVWDRMGCKKLTINKFI